MSGVNNDSATLQMQCAMLNREKVKLQKELNDLNTQNQMLRRQNYQLSALLDSAVSKLEQLGHSVVPPFDIVSSFRSLRVDKEEMMLGGGERGAGQQTWLGQDNATSKTGDHGGLQHGSNGNIQKRFRLQHELKVHRGAVLCAKYSPAAGVDALATGSADCTVAVSDYHSGKLLWRHSDPHTSHVSDICWSRDGQRLLTASFDSTCKVWDAAGMRTEALSTFSGKGYIITCSVIPAQSMQYCCADSQRWVHIVDTRDAKGSVFSFSAKSRVFSVLADSDSNRIVAGDANGCIKIYDVRSIGSGPVESVGGGSNNNNGSNNGGGAPPGVSPSRAPYYPSRSPLKPNVDGLPTTSATTNNGTTSSQQQPSVLLTHVNDDSESSISHLTSAAADDLDRLLVTSDDDMVRLYERHGQETGTPTLKLRNLMAGLSTRSHNIKASFRPGVRHHSHTMLFNEEEQEPLPNMRRLAERDLVAVGGNDNIVTVFDVTAATESPVLQKLEGHKGRVYGAEFHPQQPILASYSADATTRIWVPGKSIKQ